MALVCHTRQVPLLSVPSPPHTHLERQYLFDTTAYFFSTYKSNLNTTQRLPFSVLPSAVPKDRTTSPNFSSFARKSPQILDRDIKIRLVRVPAWPRETTTNLPCNTENAPLISPPIQAHSVPIPPPSQTPQNQHIPQT